MKRTAVYARFSSELQQEHSIDDQISLCRNYAAKNGLDVVATFCDRARSGSSIYGRDGLMELLSAAREGKFDVILTEALDRLSRDQEDLAGIYKRLNFLGIELRAVHEGTADSIQIGLRGLMGSLFLTDLAHKVRRGLQGVVRSGRNPGGRAFGYRPILGLPGELEIVEEEAVVIRRIFQDYVAGKTPREIALALNREGIRPPRGAKWTASTINGNKKRHHGIILNELYVGRLVWNRVKMVKDPDTGKRISKSNPPEEWHRADVLQLAIIDKELFETAQKRKSERSFEAPGKQRRAKFLLSGLLKCGCCGGSLVMKDRDHGRVRIHCSTMKEAGTCSNRKIFYMDEIERSVLAGLQKNLKAPHLLKEFVTAYLEERQRLASAKIQRRSQTENQLARLERSIDWLWADYESKRVPVDVAGPKLYEMQAQKTALQAELADLPEAEKQVELHPAALSHYETQVTKLQAVFHGGVTADTEEAAERIRSLIARIVIYPADTGLNIELFGRLTMILGPTDLYPNMRISASGGKMVAREGLEPPTPGL